MYIKAIFILLTKTNTVLSKTIGHFTKDDYTHASISLDRELTQLYSFGRKNPKNPFIGGFVHEDINKGLFAINRNAACAIYKLYVTDQVYNEISYIIKDMDKHKSEYKYNILGLLTIYFGINFKRKNRFFCSEFTSDILLNTDAINWTKPPALTKPSDFTNMNELRCIYTGTLSRAV